MTHHLSLTLDNHIKPGGWADGSNPDPKTWRIVNMKDSPELFKIIDDKGINVAHKFKTKEKAQAFIDFFISILVSEPEPEPPIEPPTEPDSNIDKNGVIVPAIEGFSYTGNDLYNPRENFKSNGSYRLDFNNHNLGNNVLLGGFIKPKGVNDEIAGKLGGSKHTGGGDDPETNWGRCYDIGLNIAGNRVRVRQEFPHPNTHSIGVEKSLSLGSLGNRWVGVMFAKLNTKVDGKDAVRLISWVNTEPFTSDDKVDNSGWQKILDLDRNDWPKGIWLTEYPGSPSRVDTIRTDEQDSSFAYKHVFLRQLAPKNQ